MTVYSLPAMTASALPGRPLSVALGNFDGVHLGHRRLLRAAARPDCARAVWTFSSLAKCAPHVPVLTPQEEKLRQIARSGIEYAVMEDFEAVRELTPAQDPEPGHDHREASMFTYTRRAHYHETGKMSIVHHSNYIKWKEES